MAIRRPSNSGLSGATYKDASAGNSKIIDVPNPPTIVSVTSPDDTNPTVTFTPAATGGVATTYVVTATAVSGGAQTTFTGSSSPITCTGLIPLAFYTFTIAGRTSQNNTGANSTPSAQFQVPNPPYALSQNFAASGTYTVPAGKTKLSLVVIGGGSGGNNGSGLTGGSGGAGTTAAHGASGIDVSGGQTYTVTVAGAGGTSSFGNLLNSSGTGNAATKIAPVGGGGTGGSGGFNQGVNQAGRYNANAGNAGNAGGTITIPDIGAVQYGGGGGGGGGGGQSNSLGAGGGGGGAGGALYGSSGGGGGGTNTCYFDCNNGNSGGAGTAGQAGGGGGGGGGAQGCTGFHAGYRCGSVGTGGVGGPGRVLVYAK